MDIVNTSRKFIAFLPCFILAACGGGSGLVDINQQGNRGGGTPGTPQLSVSEVVIEYDQGFSFQQDAGTRSDKVIGLFEFSVMDPTTNLFVRDLDSSNMTFVERRYGSEGDFLVEVEATQSSSIEITPINVMYLIDTSFSVIQAGANSELITQANNLANKISERNSASEDVADLTRYRTFADAVSQQQTSLVADPFDSVVFEERGGGTALYEGIELALMDLSSSPQPVLFVFTDGRENASGAGYSLELALSTAQEYNIPMYIVGLGDVDSVVLDQLATTTGGQFFQAATVDQLSQVFEDILHSIPVEYTAVYRPTQRTGHVEFQFVVNYNGKLDAVVGDFNVDTILGNE